MLASRVGVYSLTLLNVEDSCWLFYFGAVNCWSCALVITCLRFDMLRPRADCYIGVVELRRCGLVTILRCYLICSVLAGCKSVAMRVDCSVAVACWLLC